MADWWANAPPATAVPPNAGGNWWDQAPPAAPSMASGLVRSFGEGVPLLGGLLNKADAATNAALAPVLNPLFAEKDQLKGDFGERYRQSLATQEGEDAAFAQEHPIASTAANIAGGIAATGGAAATGTGAKLLGLTQKTLLPAKLGGQGLGMIGAGALSGAAIGATDEAIRGGDPTEGALFGGAGGAAGPVVGRVAEEVAAPVARAFRGMFNPDAEAARRVAGSLNRDIESQNAGLTPGEFRRAQREGQPVGLIDIGGETTRALARSAANTSPEARAELQRFTQDRFEGQGGRVEDWLNSKFNYPNADETQKAIDDVAKTVNRGAYAKAHSRPAAKAMWDEGFEQLMQAPVVQQAAKAATSTGANRSAVQGFTPVQRPFEFHDTDSLTPRYTQRVDDQGRKVLPSLEFWDSVKRNLDDKISSLQRSGEKSAARDAQNLRSALVSHLDNLVPEYADARAGAARFFGAEDALEAGRNAVTSRMENPKVASGLAKMSPIERKLFQDGFVDQYVRMVRESPDRRSILNKIGSSPAARDRLNMALGQPRARELETFLRVEGLMDRARNAISGNSTTIRQLAELGLAGGYNLYEGGGHASTDPTVLARTAMIYGALRGSRALGTHIDERVVQRIAKLLTSSNVRDLDQGIKIISKNNRLFSALRGADIATRGVVSGVEAGRRQRRPSVYVTDN